MNNSIVVQCTNYLSIKFEFIVKRGKIDVDIIYENQDQKHYFDSIYPENILEFLATESMFTDSFAVEYSYSDVSIVISHGGYKFVIHEVDSFKLKKFFREFYTYV